MLCVIVCVCVLAIMEILFIQNVGTCVDSSHMSSQAAKYIVTENFCITCIKSFSCFRIRIRIRSLTRSRPSDEPFFHVECRLFSSNAFELFCHVHLSAQLFHFNSAYFWLNIVVFKICNGKYVWAEHRSSIFWIFTTFGQFYMSNEI